MRNSSTKTWVEVSKSALRSNAAALRRAVGADVKLMSVVKSNAYGHGLALVAKTLATATDWFGVDSLDEAKTVATAAPKKPILILGYTRLADVPDAVRRGLRIIAYDKTTLTKASRAARKSAPARVHIKIETGTSRQGVDAQELPYVLRLAKRLPNLVVEGFSTHYADIEDTTDSGYAMSQLSRFKEALTVAEAYGIKPALLHTAASAAAFLHASTHFSLVRSGIASYGLWPSDETRKASEKRRLHLAPALEWKTVVAQVKRLAKGTPVSYGLTERVGRDSIVAVLPIGYWDGYDRGLSSKAHVIVRGRRAKVLGRVCMNMVVADVTDIPSVKQEDIATLIGADGAARVTAEELAAHAGTINYEIVTRINPLIPRVAVA